MVTKTIFLMIIFFSCHETRVDKEECNKIQNLFSEILRSNLIYIAGPQDKIGGTKYLASNEFIQEGTIFKTTWNDSIISLQKSIILRKNLYGDYIQFDSISFNNDTSHVKLRAYFESAKGTILLTDLSYSLDSSQCNWVLEKADHTYY